MQVKHSLKWLSVIALSNDRPRNLISNRLFLYNIEKHFVLCTSDITPVVHGPFSLFLTSLFAERLAKATEKKETYFSRRVYQEKVQPAKCRVSILPQPATILYR